jgi:hypothetical protein
MTEVGYLYPLTGSSWLSLGDNIQYTLSDRPLISLTVHTLHRFITVDMPASIAETSIPDSFASKLKNDPKLFSA